jgi:predicted metal-dependent HD superfamily phosphohydrolase
MSSVILQTWWSTSWDSIGAEGDGLALMRKLIAAYEQPQRKYHTLQHLAECLSLFDEYAGLADEPGETGIALWFHDAVYDVRASNNENKSAEWAEAELQQAEVARERIERITQMILATRHDMLPRGQDQALLVDIDLAILGAARPRFMEYEAQIRAEYAWVPEDIFKQKRSAVLRKLLARKPLYATPELRELLEHHAKANLAYSLQLLDPHGKASKTRYGPCR